MCVCPLFSHVSFQKVLPTANSRAGVFSLLTFVICVAILHLEVLTMVITCPVDSVLSINKACAISATAIFFQKSHAYVNAAVQIGALSFTRLGWGEGLEMKERRKDRRTQQLFLKYSFQKHIK